MTRLVYVAGPFRPKTAHDQWEQWENIRRAAALALQVWKLGASCICPHLNTAFFEGAAPSDVWLDGDLVQLARCDAVLMTPDWQRSSGAKAEHEFAKARKIPVFYDVETLASWLKADPMLPAGVTVDVGGVLMNAD